MGSSTGTEHCSCDQEGIKQSANAEQGDAEQGDAEHD
jgi:hypothetical protein